MLSIGIYLTHKLIKEDTTMTSLQGSTNYREYYEFVYQNTHLTIEEAFVVCMDYWNKGVHKYDVVKKINEEGKEA